MRSFSKGSALVSSVGWSLYVGGGVTAAYNTKITVDALVSTGINPTMATVIACTMTGIELGVSLFLLDPSKWGEIGEEFSEQRSQLAQSFSSAPSRIAAVIVSSLLVIILVVAVVIVYYGDYRSTLLAVVGDNPNNEFGWIAAVVLVGGMEICSTLGHGCLRRARRERITELVEQTQMGPQEEFLKQTHRNFKTQARAAAAEQRWQG